MKGRIKSILGIAEFYNYYMPLTRIPSVPARPTALHASAAQVYDVHRTVMSGVDCGT